MIQRSLYLAACFESLLEETFESYQSQVLDRDFHEAKEVTLVCSVDCSLSIVIPDQCLGQAPSPTYIDSDVEATVLFVAC